MKFEKIPTTMPVCKAEAHRALELLEDYYSRLDENEEKELKAAIERVIKIFKSRLFQVSALYHDVIEILQNIPAWTLAQTSCLSDRLSSNC